MRIFVLGLLLALCAASATRAEEIGGYTNLTRSEHGIQVEYLSPEGGAFLWYPGNRNILVGRWEEQGDKVCFAYGENTYNPVTGHRGGGFECMSSFDYWRSLSERMPGDLLALQGRGRVPFDLTGKNTNLSKILSSLAPGQAAPPTEVGVQINGKGQVMTCASILANQTRSVADTQIAITTFFHGIFMGQPCGEVDYDRAYALSQQARLDFEPFARILRERAAGGSPTAIATVKRLGL